MILSLQSNIKIRFYFYSKTLKKYAIKEINDNIYEINRKA